VWGRGMMLSAVITGNVLEQEGGQAGHINAAPVQPDKWPLIGFRPFPNLSPIAVELPWASANPPQRLAP
jgi:hypothetical protein